MILEPVLSGCDALAAALRGAPTMRVDPALVPLFSRLAEALELRARVEPGPALAWGRPWAGDSSRLGVAFTGGKDSLAVALRGRAAGSRVELFFATKANKGYSQERAKAQALAHTLGLPLRFYEAPLPAKPEGFAEHPLKNVVILAAMIDALGPRGTGRFSLGNYSRERVQHENPRAGFSDAFEVVEDFAEALRAWGAPVVVETALRDELDAWDEIRARAPELLAEVESCIMPNYRRPNLRKANERKYGAAPFLPGRCGSCYKCAEEYLYHSFYGLLPRSEAYARRALELEEKTRGPAGLYRIFAGGPRNYHPTTEASPMTAAPPTPGAGPAPLDLASLDYPNTPIRIECTGSDMLPLDALEEFQGGLKRRTARDLDNIILSILRYGFSFPFFVWRNEGHNWVLDGHGRIAGMAEFRRRGGVLPTFPTIYVDAKDEAEANNKLLRLNSQYGTMTAESVLEFADGVSVDWGELRLMGGELDFSEPLPPRSPEEAARSLAARFIVPPFSVLDSRQGYWQERRRAWLDLGIKSEVGRGENLLKMSDAALNGYDKGPPKMGVYKPGAAVLKTQGGGYTGTSVFDPVLCELIYRWFSPRAGARVLDPFAGGSVRGVVAAKLERRYVGVELRGEQVEANKAQAAEILPTSAPHPHWINGDSSRLPELLAQAGEEEPFDLVFSCPPYHDLEVYSDDPADLSNLSWPDFSLAYKAIIAAAVARLAPNRFAAFVVSEIRDPRGFYKGFVPLTIEAFEEAGATFYNEAILVNSAGSLPLRVGRIFQAGRKLGRCHQNVLVFFKGNPDQIPAEFEPVAIPEEAFTAESQADVQDGPLPE